MGRRSDVHGLSRATENSGRIPVPPRRWRTRVLVPLVIAAAFLGLLAYGGWERFAPATEVRVVAVVVKSVAGSVEGAVTVQGPGWLEPDPHPYFVSALTDGVIEELLVLEGDKVEAGQVVARLIDEDARLERERAAAVLEERRGAVAAAQAELEAAQVAMDNLIDLQEAVDRARAGTEAVAAEKLKLMAEIHSAESMVLATEDELQRKTKLVTNLTVSRGEVARLELRLESEQAALTARRAGIPVLDAQHKAAGARLQAATRRAELLIDERRALSLAQAGLSTALAAQRRAEAELAQAELRLQRTEVRAAAPGVVSQRLVSPGSRLQVSGSANSAHIAHLYDPQRLQVRVDVPFADAGHVGVGQRAEILVDALPDRSFSGQVTRLVHFADVAKNTVEVKVAVEDPEPVLKPEMLARVRFFARSEQASGEALRQRVFAPRSAIESAGGRARVLVVAERSGERGRVEARDVTLGTLEIEDHVEILSGLRPGDQVIIGAPPGLAVGGRVVVTGGSR